MSVARCQRGIVSAGERLAERHGTRACAVDEQSTSGSGTPTSDLALEA